MGMPRLRCATVRGGHAEAAPPSHAQMVAKSSSQKGSSSPAAAITVHLKSASGRLIESLAVSGDDTVEELKHIVAASSMRP